MKKLFVLAAAIAFGMASCSDPAITPEPKQGNVSIVLTNGDAAATRADGDPKDGTAEENKINSIEIYVFNDKGDALDDKVGEENGYLKVDVSTATFPWSTQVQMAGGTNKDVIVVANANLGAPVTTAGSEKLNTFAKVMEAVDAAVLDATNSTKVPATGFVMSGHTLLAKVDEGRSDNVIEIGLNRLVARVEYPTVGSTITYDLDQKELDQVFGKTGDVSNVTSDDNLSFTLNGYWVLNGMKKSTVGFVGNNINDGTVGTDADKIYSNDSKPYVMGGTDGTTYWSWNLWLENFDNKGSLEEGAGYALRGGRTESNSEAMKAADKTPANLSEWDGIYSGKALLTAGNVYAYESKPDRKADQTYSGYDPDGVIAIIISGTLTDSSTAIPNPKIRYWRVNVRVQDSYHIIRNSTYTTAINAIKTPGYETPWEAEESEEIVAKPGDTVGEFEISVNPWTIKEVGNGGI
jgi:hypothetical protein